MADKHFSFMPQPAPPLPSWARPGPAKAPNLHEESPHPAVGDHRKDGVIERPQMVAPEVISALNATTQGAALSPPAGTIESITPISFDMVAIPRGRMYAELWVEDSGGDPMACLWRGYLQTSGDMVAGPTSLPGFACYPGYNLRAVVTQTGQGAATRVGFHVHVQTDPDYEPTSVGQVFWEAPGTGPGEMRRWDFAVPAAGADYAFKQVPAKSAWRPVGFQGTLTASAIVDNRIPRFEVVDSGSNNVAGSMSPILQPASTTVKYRGGRRISAGGAAGGSAAAFALPDVVVPAGAFVQVVTEKLSGTDQWSAGCLYVEEWAVP